MRKRQASIDLHGLTVDEAIRTFVARYNALVADGCRDRIEVIHGYGSTGEGGAIRRNLRAFIDAHRDRFRAVSTGDSLGNPGVTVVEPKGRLPVAQASSAMEGAILAFCATAKTEAKIMAKFVGRYGDPSIRTAIRAMVRAGVLEELRSGGEVKYRAADSR